MSIQLEANSHTLSRKMREHILFNNDGLAGAVGEEGEEEGAEARRRRKRGR